MKIKDRIKELRRVKADLLVANPSNWRTHPESQVAAMQGILAEVGYADALLARELPDGTLELIDGHLRQSLDPEQEVPVLVVDLNEDEAKKLLTVLDPLAAMAEANQEALDSLLSEISTDNDALSDLLLSLSSGINDEETKFKQLDVKKPPAMTWVLVGIPTVRFGEISETVERIAKIENVILETTSNDG